MTSVLLVHGAWHGAWCWEPVQALLPDARAIDLPSVWAGGDFAADVAAVRAALDAGETVMANGAPATPPTALTSAIVIDGTEISVDGEQAGTAFYGDCDEPPVDRLRTMSLAAFGTPVTVPAWKDKPSTYVVCTQDQAIHPDAQRFFATRCSTVVELEASHSPMLSMPDRVAEILRAATD